MDPVTLTFYAIVCGALGVIAPGLGSLATRLIVGGAVGIVAAALLPIIRSQIGV